MREKLLKRVPLSKLMDLKIDYAFKQLFGNEQNKDMTVIFLNAILKRTGRERITEISFTNSEAGGEYEDDKQSRLDLLVITEGHEWINVEIQFTNHYDMIKRSLYYWSGVYRLPMKKNMSYKALNPVISINILNFKLFNQTDAFHTIYHLRENEEKFKLTDVMEFHFIEISKLIKDWKVGKLDPWNDVLARWLLMLGMVDRRHDTVYKDIYKKLEEIAMKDETLQDAFRGWEDLSLTQEQRLAYEARLKRVLDEEAAQREAVLREEEAKKVGRERGERIGKEIGKELGKELGKEIGEKAGRQAEKDNIARRLLKTKMDLKSISEITELKQERIIELKQREDGNI